MTGYHVAGVAILLTFVAAGFIIDIIDWRRK